MKLYNENMPAPNPRRVRMYLAEKGIDVPLVHIAMMKREHKSPEFRAKNSLGQVPSLELDDGTVISESVSICRYLEALHPEKPLFGRTPLEIAQIDMWLRRIEFVIMTPIGNYWRHAHPYTSKLLTQFKDFGESNVEAASRSLQWLDRELEGHDYVVGNDFSVADIMMLCSIDFGIYTGLNIPDDCGNVKAWHERVSARPSSKA
ncbi:MAG: glutathione S-transferase family protein [Parvibaculum sp.]|nr:glutathione S-transferase family protein [Parvibaculum sp.]